MPSRLIPLTFPNLETTNLLLRPLTLSDVEAVFRNFSDPEVVKYFMDPLVNIADAEGMVRELIDLFETGKGMFWALTLKADGAMIGTCSFEKVSSDRRGEVGFDLAPAWWGQGLMREALTAVINYGFDVLGLKEIFAITTFDNRRALRLLKRLGFQGEGEKKDKLQLSLKRKA